MPDFDSLSSQERTDLREDVAALAAAGLPVSLSQAAKATDGISSWRGGRLPTAILGSRYGWDISGVRPEYTHDEEHGRSVYLTEADARAAAIAAKERTTAQEPTLLGYLHRDGTIRHLPVVTVVRRTRQPVEQLLTGKVWGLVRVPGLVLAEIPVNAPHRPDRGIPCACCDVNGAQRLRRDQRGRPGLICNICADTMDMKTRMWPTYRD
ncbi:hypothetical protein ACIOEX_02395 [Streptomyces sp. NPDC087850]|uniref:hypothetical protein n=1 Tax=Streptomyces sp. NPDC087850 TaxID=3365809 RepID=UPI00381AC86D